MMIAVKTGDLYLSSGRGGGGLGDPLLRPEEPIEEDIAGGHVQRRWAERAYGLENREGLMHQRLERARPAPEWWAEQRQRILDQDLIETVKVMYAESMRAGTALGRRVPRLLGPARGLRLRRRHPDRRSSSAPPPASSRPRTPSREFLDGSEVFLPAEPGRRSR